MAAEKGVKSEPEVWLPLLEDYRMLSLARDTVLEGRLKPEFGPDSPEVVQVLRQWPARAHVSKTAGGTEVVLVYQLKNEPWKLPWMHALLLFVTLITTLGSGAMMAGTDPFRTHMLELGSFQLPYPTSLDLALLWGGAAFALPFLAVLLAHEMGHWCAARHHRVRASLPYFMPCPPYLSVIGTLGAFIRLRGPSVRRSILFDIGASGPFASFIVSVPLFIAGIALSRTLPVPASIASPFVVRFTGQPIWLGNGGLTHMLATWFGPGPVGEAAILLHPFALAGWLGLFVTALNLLPLGQLDGGHVLYALTPAKHGRLARLFLGILVVLGTGWWGWWAWAALVFLLHRGNVLHPPVLQPEPGLNRVRAGLAGVLILVFVACFVMVPIDL